jgi:hypothetical protein
MFRACPDWGWAPPSLLYNGYRVFPGGKEWPGRDADPSPLLVPWSIKGRRGVRGQCHVPAALYLRERPDTHSTGGWMGPKVSLDRCRKSRPHWDLIPECATRSQSLYQLSYLAPNKCKYETYINKRGSLRGLCCLHFRKNFNKMNHECTHVSTNIHPNFAALFWRYVLSSPGKSCLIFSFQMSPQATQYCVAVNMLPQATGVVGLV